MWAMITKAVVTALFIIALTEIAKRNAFLSAVIIAFPLVTILTVANLYYDTGDAARASKFAYTTFWLIIASLAFFPALYLFQKTALPFWPSFGFAIFTTVGFIWGLTNVLRYFGIDLLSNA